MRYLLLKCKNCQRPKPKSPLRKVSTEQRNSFPQEEMIRQDDKINGWLFVVWKENQMWDRVEIREEEKPI